MSASVGLNRASPSDNANAVELASSPEFTKANTEELIAKSEKEIKVQKIVIIVFAAIAAAVVLAALIVLAAWAIGPLAGSVALGVGGGSVLTIIGAAMPVLVCRAKTKELEAKIQDQMLGFLRSNGAKFSQDKLEVFKKHGKYCTNEKLLSDLPISEAGQKSAQAGEWTNAHLVELIKSCPHLKCLELSLASRFSIVEDACRERQITITMKPLLERRANAL